jgi:hypothetical protein
MKRRQYAKTLIIFVNEENLVSNSNFDKVFTQQTGFTSGKF